MTTSTPIIKTRSLEGCWWLQLPRLGPSSAAFTELFLTSLETQSKDTGPRTTQSAGCSRLHRDESSRSQSGGSRVGSALTVEVLRGRRNRQIGGRCGCEGNRRVKETRDPLWEHLWVQLLSLPTKGRLGRSGAVTSLDNRRAAYSNPMVYIHFMQISGVLLNNKW